MKWLRRLFIILLATIVYAAYAYATWSIIVYDPKTKEIGIAGALCTYCVYGIGAIAPGKGAIIVQAMSNNEARSKALKMIKAGSMPWQIFETIRKPEFDPEEQQYAVLCVNDWQIL